MLSIRNIGSQLVFDKGADMKWRKDRFFNTGSWNNWTITCQKIKENAYLIPYTKTIQSGYTAWRSDQTI